MQHNLKTPKKTIALLLFFGAAGIFYIATANRIENPGADTSMYLELGKSLVGESRYWFNFEPHTIYPPGFPVLLAAFLLLVGDAYSALTKLNAAIGFLGIVGTYLLFRVQRRSQFASLIALFLIVSPLCYFWMTSGLSSDPFYFTVSICLFLAIEKYNDATALNKRILFWLGAVFLSGYLVITRGAGAAIIVALMMWGLFPLLSKAPDKLIRIRQRMKVALPAFLSAVVVLLVWNAWTHRHKTPDYTNFYMNSYFTQILIKDPHTIDSDNLKLSDIPERVYSILSLRSANFIKVIFGVDYIKPSLLYFPVFLACFLTITGLVYSIHRGDRITDWYVLSYLGVFLIYPFDEHGRYLFPILPFLLFYCLTGIFQVKILFLTPLGKANFFALFLTLTLILVVNILLYFHSSSTGLQDLLNLVLWLGAILFFLCSQTGFLLDYPSIFGHKIRPLLPNGINCLLVVLASAVVISGAMKIATISSRHLSVNDRAYLQSGTLAASQWIKANTEKEDIIMGEHFAILHRTTGRKTYRFPLTTEVELMGSAIQKLQVDYIVVLNKKRYEYYHPSVYDRFVSLRGKYERAFNLSTDFGIGKIYRVDHAALK